MLGANPQIAPRSVTAGDYPALFQSADASATSFQRKYLGMLLTEYGLLFVASVLSINFFTGANAAVASALILALSVVIVLARSIGKPEQDWYKARAMAESVKTLSWRYMMRAQPFSNEDPSIDAKREFRTQLKKLVQSEAVIFGKIAGRTTSHEEITGLMEEVRGQPLSARKKFYRENRILEQRSWYTRKARTNRTFAQTWACVSIAAYLTAGVLSLIRIEVPGWPIWPIEPLLVLASSITGWIQIKKFNELSAVYTVTAHEIGLIDVDGAETEEVFSTAVVEAELAFSREHTSWIARQNN